MFCFPLFLIGCAILNADVSNGIECFHCAYFAGDETSSADCVNFNTTVISDCENSTACIQLSYENPETGEYDNIFLDCGATQCTETNSDGLERVEFNTSYKNFTKKTTCFSEDYGNCISSVCNEAKVAHLEAIEVNATEATTASATIECFRCAHIPQINATSPSCLEDRTSEHTLCPGNTCMKLAQRYNNGSTDYIIYTLDCGQGKCDDSIADGEERSTVIPGPDPILESLTCCSGDYCNCKSLTCLESIGVTASSDVPEESTYAPTSQSLLMNTTSIAKSSRQPATEITAETLTSGVDSSNPAPNSRPQTPATSVMTSQPSTTKRGGNTTKSENDSSEVSTVPSSFSSTSASTEEVRSTSRVKTSLPQVITTTTRSAGIPIFSLFCVPLAMVTAALNF